MPEWLGAAFKRLCAICRRIPLFGRLGEVPSDARREAFYETLTTTAFATMPFWVLPALGYFIFSPKPDYLESFNKGEGLVFASALLGPLVYVITKRYGRFNFRDKRKTPDLKMMTVSFPYGGAFATITALTCAIAGFSFAAMKNSAHNPNGFDQAGITILSWALMLGSTVIFFLVTAYSNMLDDLIANKAETVVDAQPEQEKEFVSEWLRARR